MHLSIRTIAVVLAAGVASALAPATTASAFVDIPLYDYLYFSDATHTEIVGWHQGFCNGSNPAVLGPPQGTTTSYGQQIQVGVCRNGFAIYW